MARALHGYAASASEQEPWWGMGVGLFLAFLCSLCLPTDVADVGLRGAPASRWRVVVGWLLAAAGTGSFGYATFALYVNWEANFDLAWLVWLGGAVLLSVGLDLAWGRASRRAEPLIGRTDLLVMVAILVVAAIFRLFRLASAPGEGSITQVEELQVGNWAVGYLKGFRGRWEFIGHVWVAAAGIWLHGPSLYGMRFGFAVISALKVIPLYLWLSCTVGRTGAVVGSLLLACAGWDVVLARIPTNQDMFVVALAFALLAWPVRAGRPSGYVWGGVIAGYLLYQYIPYRTAILFILVGACIFSWADRSVGLTVRIGRPIITLALIAGMAFPLFFGRLDGKIVHEYLNGWNRARAITSYYNPHDTWQQAAQRRIDRSFEGASLFFFKGDRNAGRNVGSRPLLDPVTGVLFVVGIGYALAHVRSVLTGLTLAGFLVTFVGTLVATGNFDVVRIGSAVSYVYALVGFGAAAVAVLLRRAWRRFGYPLAVVLLGIAVVTAGYNNTKFLSDLWTNPTTKRALRSNLALFTDWIRTNTREGEQLVSIAPQYFHVLLPNDAAWLRGGEIRGEVAWDVEAALRYWVTHPGETLLVVFAGTGTADVRKYLEWLIPGLQMSWQPDPVGAGGQIAYAHMPAVPPDLEERLASLHCRGAKVQFELIDAPPGVPKLPPKVLPFIDYSTWPGEVRAAVFRSSPTPKKIRANFEAAFKVEKPGRYTFTLETYAGSAGLLIDDSSKVRHGRVPVDLTAGEHTLTVRGHFQPLVVEPSLRLRWTGPDAAEDEEIMPLYRIGVEDPTCGEQAG